MTMKTNEGGSVYLKPEAAAQFLSVLDALPPAKKVEAVQLFRIGLSDAAEAKRERDELVKKARRAAAAKADDAELVHVIEKVNGLCDRYEAVIKSTTDENEGLRKALGEANEALRETHGAIEDFTAVAKAELAETRKAIHDLGKTAAVASPLRANPRELAARGKADAIAVLEKVAAATASEATQAHLRKEIAALKAQ